jgi:hypothetical protein
MTAPEPIPPTIENLLNRKYHSHGIDQFNTAVKDYKHVYDVPANKQSADNRKMAMDDLNTKTSIILGNINSLIGLSRGLSDTNKAQKKIIKDLQDKCGVDTTQITKLNQDYTDMTNYLNAIIEALITNITGVSDDLDFANKVTEDYIKSVGTVTTGGKKKKTVAKKKNVTPKKKTTPAKKKKPSKKKSVKKKSVKKN